ncbi:MAG TPA: hypothetical protein VD969_16990 [Symbiobacteriaceae bacterium]|nr:hypothetical protein [Symbiobacteriaceae bacterium]
MALSVLILTTVGCGGFVRAQYEVVAKEDLPVGVEHWKEWAPEAARGLVHKTNDSVYVAGYIKVLNPGADFEGIVFELTGNHDGFRVTYEN